MSLSLELLGITAWDIVDGMFQICLRKIKLFTDTCTICCLVKLYRLPFTLVEHHATVPLELIHSNVWNLLFYLRKVLNIMWSLLMIFLFLLEFILAMQIGSFQSFLQFPDSCGEFI